VNSASTHLADFSPPTASLSSPLHGSLQQSRLRTSLLQRISAKPALKQPHSTHLQTAIKATFAAIQLQNFREGSANTIAYLTAFKNIGWSNDALDWLIWERAEGSKNWKTVKTLAEVKALMIATDVGAPSEAFEQSYAVGALMYEWLIGTYGFEGYKKIINQFPSVSSFGQAVQNALGIKKNDLYDQMAEYVFKSYQKVYTP
jgi:hypothetical protein